MHIGIQSAFTVSMPPKKKALEIREEVEAGGEALDSEYSVSSPVSVASTASAMTGAPADYLEKILEANQRSMAALIAALPSVLAHPDSSASVPKSARVDIPKWADGENPWEYFGKYEQALTHNGVPKEKWGPLLQIYLSGSAQASFAQVNPLIVKDYEALKQAMLEALGDTPDGADKRWCTLSRQKGEGHRALYRRVHMIGFRRMYGLETKEQCCQRMILSKFLTLLSPECYSSVVAKRPRNGQEAAAFAQEFEDASSFARSLQPRSTGHFYKREHNSGGSSGGSSSSNGSSGSFSGSASGSGGAVPTQSQVDGNSQGSEKKGGKERQSQRERKPPTCYGCKEVGHIRPNCPNKVRRVKSPEGDQQEEVDGWLAGVAVKGLRVDTGSDRTVVRADCIPDTAYLTKTVILDSWRGKQFSKHRVAKIKIKVGTTETVAEVAVAEKLECPALLGTDLGNPMKVQLFSILLDRVKEVQSESGGEGTVAVRSTRAQTKREQEEDRQDVLLSEQSEADPLPLEGIFDFPDSYFEQDPIPTPVEECSILPEVSSVEVPLPTLQKADGDSLSEEQQADGSLEALLQLAHDGVRGYAFDQGILVHSVVDGFGDTVQRIVVPVGRRKSVLELAHSNVVAGHFGVKKTFGRISCKFLWPRMWAEVKEYVRTCSSCQRAATKSNARAPLQPLQCVDEPFQKVAFDLVGPLPKSSSGFRYLLTMMCLYTKYPEAIPLKRVDNESVLDAMFEVFASYGLPKVLLTDQGSVFTSKLTKSMCTAFDIKKIQTSPYHPQSDGALERWHACLKGMLKRSQCDLKLWDRQLKYLLFAYRSTPHCVTGFSPFTLMFGREVRGPLDMLCDSWLAGDCENAKVCDWLSSVQAKMGEMAEVVSDRERVAKGKMKELYDRKAKVKLFEAGDMVLVWKPGIHSKMADSWQGPFQVDSQVSPVTYKVQVPGKSHQFKVLHCNLLKRWSTTASKVHRVAIIHEEEGEEYLPSGLILNRQGFVPSATEQAELDKVLHQYKDVISPDPGRTDVLHLSINTGSSEPVRCHPYRIPPRWKEEVKVQIDQLLELGIIRPSTSPWSSSVVTVRKKDGGVRICIDYRAVNQVTLPDPYLMPLIEEILDTLASARFISKIDLNKGFHQIPIQTLDIPKTAFCTPWGKFEFAVMPFGLRNGPAVFQRLMDRLLHEDLAFSRVYIDDIAVFSASWEEHCLHIAQVLDRLRKAGLTANESKCQWGQTSCEFLGHIVGNGRVSPAELKVQAVREFQQPQSKKQIRQFLGLTGYYRRFVRNYAEHTFHLTEATKKTAPDRALFTHAMIAELCYLKDVLCSLPSLTLPVSSDNFILQIDASGVGLGAVLSVIREGEEWPVAFYSRKLKDRERRYSASELEGLAVVDSVLHFDAYLITHPFIIETDHRALQFLNSANHANGRIARWALRLQPYTFTIQYRPGTVNGNADALSRCFPEEDGGSSSSSQCLGPSVNGRRGEML